MHWFLRATIAVVVGANYLGFSLGAEGTVLYRLHEPLIEFIDPGGGLPISTPRAVFLGGVAWGVPVSIMVLTTYGLLTRWLG
jgi:hypothetical protein